MRTAGVVDGSPVARSSHPARRSPVPPPAVGRLTPLGAASGRLSGESLIRSAGRLGPIPHGALEFVDRSSASFPAPPPAAGRLTPLGAASGRLSGVSLGRSASPSAPVVQGAEQPVTHTRTQL